LQLILRCDSNWQFGSRSEWSSWFFIFEVFFEKLISVALQVSYKYARGYGILGSRAGSK
jgi:hypothetical protein